ncbi:MAG TPA: hypothetical protein VFY46_01460 [Acidimicrobiia bacterium]|nr:hypothetical protein [Acidimicrobiia bacterium]
MRDDRGSAPIWFLGLALSVLMVGALSAELWRVLGERQDLAGLADSAAIAAASAIDLEVYRSTGELRLDPGEAADRALAVLSESSGGGRLSAAPVIQLDPAGLSVSVELVREVPFGLIRLLSLGDDRFEVTATALAYPSSP